MPSIFNMFGRSPIKPLEEHINKGYTCAETLQDFFDAVLKDDWNKAEKVQKKISALEKEADDLKTALRLNLPKGLFLPVLRSDVLDLIDSQDKLPNKAKDIAGMVIGRKLHIPEIFAEDYREFLTQCIEAAKQARKAINELDQLLETGFRGNEVNVVDEMIRTLDKMEHESDEMQVKIRQQLFKIENTLPPVDVVFLYKLIEWTGELADRAQTIGAKLQILIAR